MTASKIFLVLMIVALTGLAGQAAAVAQDDLIATPVATETIPPVLQEWADAWSDGDPDRIAAVFARPSEMEVVSVGLRMFGDPIAIRDTFAENIASFDDVEVRLISGFGTAEQAAVEGWFVGHYSGDDDTFDGQRIAVRFSAHFLLQENEITRLRFYSDLSGLLFCVWPVLPPNPAGSSIARRLVNVP